MPKLINRVREIRLQTHDTQQSLADAIGISRQALIQIEKGRVSPTGSVMLAIARHFQMDVGDIFFDPFVKREGQNSHEAVT